MSTSCSVHYPWGRYLMFRVKSLKNEATKPEKADGKWCFTRIKSRLVDLPVVHVSHHLHLQLRGELLRLHGVHVVRLSVLSGGLHRLHVRPSDRLLRTPGQETTAAPPVTFKVCEKHTCGVTTTTSGVNKVGFKRRRFKQSSLWWSLQVLRKTMKKHF